MHLDSASIADTAVYCFDLELVSSSWRWKNTCSCSHKKDRP